MSVGDSALKGIEGSGSLDEELAGESKTLWVKQTILTDFYDSIKGCPDSGQY